MWFVYDFNPIRFTVEYNEMHTQRQTKDYRFEMTLFRIQVELLSKSNDKTAFSYRIHNLLCDNKHLMGLSDSAATNRVTGKIPKTKLGNSSKFKCKWIECESNQFIYNWCSQSFRQWLEFRIYVERVCIFISNQKMFAKVFIAESIAML